MKFESIKDRSVISLDFLERYSGNKHLFNVDVHTDANWRLIRKKIPSLQIENLDKFFGDLTKIIESDAGNFKQLKIEAEQNSYIQLDGRDGEIATKFFLAKAKSGFFSFTSYVEGSFLVSPNTLARIYTELRETKLYTR